MRKTSVYLSDEQAERLARLAGEEKRPQAEILRDAIDSYRSRPSTPDRNFLMSGCVSGDGTSVADLDMDELMKGFSE